ncbi:MAG: glycosyltransferase family 9 protein, partial [Nitrospinales bacterium]
VSHYVKIFRTLKAQPPDVIFLFHVNDPFVYCLAYLVCPGNLIGFKSDNPFSFLLSTTIAQDDHKHMILNYLNLTARIGAQTDNLKMNFELDPGVISSGRKFFSSPEIFPYTVGFQLGSGDKRRCWPKDHYVKLGLRMLNELQARIILLGSPKEKDLVREINTALNGRAVEGITDLLTAAGIIQNLDLLVTPDTGPMHMALALNTPTVALYGPSHPKNFGPLDNSGKNIVIHKAPIDQPYVKLSGDFPEVMDQISPEEVFQAARTLLEEGVRETRQSI